jgi:hypothetical protein
METTLPTPIAAKPIWMSAWIRIVRNHLWFRNQPYQTYDLDMLYETPSLDHLQACLNRRDWPLGHAFYFDNICFVKIKPAEDEWIIIRNDAYQATLPVQDYTRSGRFAEFIAGIREPHRERLRTFPF